MIRSLILGGLGFALLPTFLVGDDLRAGRLKALGQPFVSSDIPIHAVYPHRKYLSAKVRHFVDYLGGICGANPPWDEGLESGPDYS